MHRFERPATRRRVAPRPSLRTLLAAAALLAAAGCSDPQAMFDRHLSRARTLLEEGRSAQAGVELRNAMRLQPAHAEPLYLVGRLAEADQNFQSAFQHYRRAVELDPAHVSAMSRLAMFLLLGGNTAEAAAMASRIDAAAPESIAARSARAALLAAEGKVPEAIALGRTIVEAAPGDRDVVPLLAGLLTGMKDEEGVRKLLDQAIAADPKWLQFRTMQAALLRRLGHSDEAERHYRAVVELAPSVLEHRVRLAQYLASLRRLDDAEKVLREAVAADAKDDARALALADFLADRRSPAAAADMLREAVARRPDAFPLHLRLAALELAGDRSQEGEARLLKVLKEDGRGASAARARIALVELYARNGRRTEAEKLNAEALARNGQDRDALLWRARFAFDDRRYMPAITDLRTVLRDHADHAEAAELLGRTYRANGQSELAIAFLRDTVDRFPLRADLRLMLADQLASAKRLDEARTEVDAALKVEPRNLRALLSSFSLDALERRWASARATAERIKEVAPQQPVGALRLAQSLAATGQGAAALREVLAAVDRFPASMDAWMALVELAADQGRTELAVQRLRAAIDADPKFSGTRLLLGNVLVGRKDLPAAQSTFRQLVEFDPQLTVAWINLARVHQAMGQGSEAVAALQSGLRARPQDPALATQLAALHVSAGDAPAAVSVLEEAHRRSPGDDTVANNLAALLSEGSPDAARLERARALAARFATSDNPYFLDTLGRILYLQGRDAEAVPLLRKAVALAPELPVLKYHLGMALVRSGDRAGGLSLLRDALAANPRFPGSDVARKALSDG